jgi:hypothetical protein
MEFDNYSNKELLPKILDRFILDNESDDIIVNFLEDNENNLDYIFYKSIFCQKLYLYSNIKKCSLHLQKFLLSRFFCLPLSIAVQVCSTLFLDKELWNLFLSLNPGKRGLIDKLLSKCDYYGLSFSSKAYKNSPIQELDNALISGKFSESADVINYFSSKVASGRIGSTSSLGCSMFFNEFYCINEIDKMTELSKFMILRKMQLSELSSRVWALNNMNYEFNTNKLIFKYKVNLIWQFIAQLFAFNGMEDVKKRIIFLLKNNSENRTFNFKEFINTEIGQCNLNDIIQLVNHSNSYDEIVMKIQLMNGDIDAFNALTYMTLIKPKFAEDAIKYDKEEFEKVIPGASLFINA